MKGGFAMRGIDVDLEKLKGAIPNQTQLAEYLGIARYSLYRKLRGRQKLNFDEFNQICTFLRRNAKDFLVEFDLEGKAA